MNNLCMIACISKDGGLGNQGKLLWHIPEDMQFFKRITMGGIVVMGRKTFESIGRALPGRENVVLSRGGVEAEGVRCLRDEGELRKWLGKSDKKQFIIGGASLYKKFLPEAEVIYLTEVDATKPADVFFPKFNRNEFRPEELESGEYQGTKYRMMKYTRKGNL